MINVYAGQTAPYYPTLQPSPSPPRNTGTVYITTNPGAALIYVDGGYQGKSPLTVTLFSGSLGVTVLIVAYTATCSVSAGM